MTIFSPGAGHDTFTIDAGEIVFVPRGYLHHIENIYEGETKFAIAFNHERPEDIGISGATGSMVDRVLGYTFGVDSQYFSNLKRHPPDILITSKESVITTTTTTGTTKYHKSKIPNLHKFNLKGTPPVVQTKGGTASFATANNFEIVAVLLALY
jgi:oxalate decarboxylase